MRDTHIALETPDAQLLIAAADDWTGALLADPRVDAVRRRLADRGLTEFAVVIFPEAITLSARPPGNSDAGEVIVSALRGRPAGVLFDEDPAETR